jgi:regulator of sigma E protease
MSMSWLWILSFIPALYLLVFLHELGHFVVGIWMKVKVEEFGFGFPPRMLTMFHWRGVPITLNWLPIGGFVRFAGEEGNFDQEGSLASAPPWRKIPIMFAGPFMNLVAAAVIFALVGMVGQPERIGTVQISRVSLGSAAEQAGLQARDFILAIDGQPVQSAQQLRELIGPRQGVPTRLDIERTDEQNGTTTLYVTVTPGTCSGVEGGCLGVAPYVPADRAIETTYIDRMGFWQAIGHGIQETGRLFGLILASLGALLAPLFGGEAQAGGGFVGIVGMGQATAEIGRTTGITGYLNWIGLISVNLALFNLLPIPALDGSRILFALIEWVRRGKRVPPEKEALVHAVGMVMLLGLMVLVTISDIRNLWQGQNPLGG